MSLTLIITIQASLSCKRDQPRIEENLKEPFTYSAGHTCCVWGSVERAVPF